MEDAQDCLLALNRCIGDGKVWVSDDQHTIATALLQTAVQYYVRATIIGAKADERGSESIDDELPPALLADHLAIKSIRHDGLTHIKLDQPIAGTVWHKGAILAVERNGRWKIEGCSGRMTYDIETKARLDRLIPAAVEILHHRCKRCFDEIVPALNAEANAELWALADRCPVDPVEYFGSVEAAAQFFYGDDE